MASQFFALALFVSDRKSAWKAPLFMAGIVCTGSGTGLIALAVGVVLSLLKLSWKSFIGTAFGLALMLGTIQSLGIGNRILDRTGEFSVPGSSGNTRFIAPWEHLSAYQGRASFLDLVLGVGPGGVEVTSNFSSLSVNYTLIVQAFVELGVVSGLIFLLMVFLRVSRSSLPLPARGVMLVALFFLSGAMYQIFTCMLVWYLCGNGTPRQVAYEQGKNNLQHSNSEKP